MLGVRLHPRLVETHAVPNTQQTGWAPDAAWSVWRAEKSLAPAGKGNTICWWSQLAAQFPYRPCLLRCHIKIVQNLHAGPTITIGRHEKGLEITSSGPLFLNIAEYRYIWHDHHAYVNTVQKTLLTELHIVRTAIS
jgi:hypothetical protein